MPKMLRNLASGAIQPESNIIRSKVEHNAEQTKMMALVYGNAYGQTGRRLRGLRKHMLLRHTGSDSIGEGFSLLLDGYEPVQPTFRIP